MLIGVGWLKQFSLFVCASDLLRQPPGIRAAIGVELAQLRHGFLHNLAATP